MQPLAHARAETAPRPVLLAVVGMIGLALAGTVLFRLTSVPPQPVPAEPLSDSLSLLFRDAEDGSVLALDAQTSRLLRRYAPGSGGFTRGMLRGLSRQRGARGLDLAEPYVLGRRADGRLVLRDPMLEVDIVLDAFGTSNRSVFEALITEPGVAAAGGAGLHSAGPPAATSGAAPPTGGDPADGELETRFKSSGDNRS